MFKVSAVPPRRSAVLTVFRGATAINDGTTAEPRRSWRCECGLGRTRTAVTQRLLCVEGVFVFINEASAVDDSYNDNEHNTVLDFVALVLLLFAAMK